VRSSITRPASSAALARSRRLAKRGRVPRQTHLNPLDCVQQEAPVDGQRTLRERVLPEHHQTDPIPLSAPNEIRNNPLREIEPRHPSSLQGGVQRIHASRGIEGDHEIDSLPARGRLGQETDRHGQSNTEER
jgi:hypothetical protein